MLVLSMRAAARLIPERLAPTEAGRGAFICRAPVGGGMSEQQKRPGGPKQSQRLRISPGLRMVPLNDWEDLLSSDLKGALFQQDPYEVRERVNGALSDYSVAVRCFDSQQRKTEATRDRLLKAVLALRDALQTTETRALLDELEVFPVAQALFGAGVSNDLGRIPRGLTGDLVALEIALRNRVNSPDWETRDRDEPPAFSMLIGHLKNIHQNAVAPASLAFEPFACAVLHAAEVCPVNGAKFSQTAIRDALKTYRAFNKS